MPITLSEFNEIEKKVITLMGMSGVGKTYLSMIMDQNGWKHHSCDLEIGTKYLGADIEKTLGVENTIKAEDLSLLSEYVGRLGAIEKGGLPFDEFKRRQDEYFDAECSALRELKKVVAQAHEDGFQNVVHDSTGSLCEVDDETLIESIDENSLIVYIKASEEEEREVLKRAQEYPKPLFYSPEKFEEWVAGYMAENGLESSDAIDPDDFSRWTFPKLFQNRLPKYQRIADQYGVTIPSSAFHGVKNADEFLDVIRQHLPETLDDAVSVAS